jgi:DNA polymerase IV
VTDSDVISQALTSHSEAVARRARRAGLVGRTISIKIKLARSRGTHEGRISGEREPDYPLLSRSRSLEEPTADGALLRRVALELWKRARIGEPVRLLGVTLSSLQPDLSRPTEDNQLSLFGPAADPSRDAARRSEALGKTLDAIEAKFGRHALHRAVRTPEKLTQSDRRKVGEEPDDS